MNSAQDRLIVGATLLSESAWLFAVFSMVGLVLGAGRSPLGWLAALAILAASFFVTRTLQLVIMPTMTAYVFQMFAGVVIIYLTLSTQIPFGAQGVNLWWVTDLVLGPDPAKHPFTAAMGGIFAVALWSRGATLAAVDHPVDHLGGSFRLGVIVMAIAAVVDVFHAVDLNVLPLMLLFFGVGLAGLSIGHLLPASVQAVKEKAWPRTIGAVVSVVLVTGLFFSLLHGSVLLIVSSSAKAVLMVGATVVFYVVLLPIGLVLGLVVTGLVALWRWLAGDAEPFEIQPSTLLESILEEGEQVERQGPALAQHLLEWTLLAIFIVAVLSFLAMAFRRRARRRVAEEEGMRESVLGDADPVYDLAKLLFSLLPRRLKRMRAARTNFRLPDDDADLVEIFRIYFGLLSLAEERGFPKAPAETPNEYQGKLERIFPPNLVRTATAAFVRACYGHRPAPRQQIDEMRVSLEQLASQGG